MKLRNLIPVGAALLIGTVPVLGEATNPELKNGAMPAYPQDARLHGVEGVVVVEALVDESGRVLAAEVVESVDRNLDNVTLDAVNDWTFKPATEDGEPVMKVVRITVRYDLVNPVELAEDRAIASK